MILEDLLDGTVESSLSALNVLEYQLMLMKHLSDAVSSRGLEDVGVGQEGGASERGDGVQVKADDETRLWRCAEIGYFVLVKAGGPLVVI